MTVNLLPKFNLLFNLYYKSQPIAQDVELLQRVEIGKSSELTITSLRVWFREDDKNFCPAKYPNPQ